MRAWRMALERRATALPMAIRVPSKTRISFIQRHVGSLGQCVRRRDTAYSRAYDCNFHTFLPDSTSKAVKAATDRIWGASENIKWPFLIDFHVR